MAYTVISFVIMLIVTVPIIILGVGQYRSKDPVGFWTGKKPPLREQITDVPSYNRKHGLMWIAYGLGMPLCFGLGLLLGDLFSEYLWMIEVIGGIPVMIIYHNRLNRIYLKEV